jgi:hypothetical protein
VPHSRFPTTTTRPPGAIDRNVCANVALPTISIATFTPSPFVSSRTAPAKFEEAVLRSSHGHRGCARISALSAAQQQIPGEISPIVVVPHLQHVAMART